STNTHSHPHPSTHPPPSSTVSTVDDEDSATVGKQFQPSVTTFELPTGMETLSLRKSVAAELFKALEDISKEGENSEEETPSHATSNSETSENSENLGNQNQRGGVTPM